MKQYIVDAFTDKVFSGNPAAVCVMEKWLPEDLMMCITRENNLSETAFTVKNEDGTYRLRWFTPGGEIDLCGHATLGTAYVIMNFYQPEADSIRFMTMSGELIVTRKNDLYTMEFPAYELKQVEVTDAMEAAMGARPLEAYMSRDLLCVFDDECLVRNMKPDFDKVQALDGLLLHATAPGKEYDCVSRSFAPKLKVLEDPVCGSGHCHIVPYWADKKGLKHINAYQASARGGALYCDVEGNKVFLAGKVALFSEGEIHI